MKMLIAFLLAFIVGWVVVSEHDRARLLKRVGDAQANIDSIADAQDFAMPLVVLSEQLARENAMFTKIIDRARDTVASKDIELVSTKEALTSSVELLQEQITENNQCLEKIQDLEDSIRLLRQTVNRLLSKLPDLEQSGE